MPHSIAISSADRAQLRRALDAAAPRECCGVLLGSNDTRQLDVRGVLLTLNAATMAGSFFIPDIEIVRVRLVAARYGERIIALFHSHPRGSVELSDADRKALACSEWPWVIMTEAAQADDVDLRYHAICPHE